MSLPSRITVPSSAVIICLFFAGFSVQKASAVVLSDYVLFARDSLVVKDRTVVSEGYLGANGYAELGIEAVLKGNLRCRHNARLNDRARVEGSVTTGGTLSRGSSTTVTGTITQNTTVDSIPIPVKSFSYGSSDFTAGVGETKTIAPGSYQDFHSYANSRVTFSAGTYNFRKLLCEPDVRLILQAPSDSIVINTAEQVTLGDRDTILVSGTLLSSRAVFYTNQSSVLTIGTDGSSTFTLSAPYATVSVGSRTMITGRISAKKIFVEPDAFAKKTAGEDYLSWSHSKNVYINTTPSGGNVTTNNAKFPLLIRLVDTNFNFSEALANGEDVRFSKSDYVTALPYEIERWDRVNGVAEVWVKVDTVYGNNATQHIVMYWGKTGVASQSNGPAVFDTANKYFGDWHLNEDPSGGAGSLKDRTSYSRHGTPSGGMTSGNQASCVVGKGVSLNGTTNYVDLGNVAVHNKTAYTFASWVRGVIQTDKRLYAESNTTDNDPLFTLGTNVSGANSKADVYIRDDAAGVQLSHAASTGNVFDTTWRYLAWVDNGGSYTFYVDGLASGTGTYTKVQKTFNKACLGAMVRGSPSYLLAASIDEVQISNTNRSAGWVKLCYENQKIGSNLIFFDTSGLKPLVSLTRLIASIREADTADTPAVKVRATLASAATSATTIPVRLGYGGPATNGIDYEPLPSVVNITVPRDSTTASVTLSIKPIQDAIDEPRDTIVVSVVRDTANYRTSGSDTVRILLIDDDSIIPPVITLQPRDTTIAEGTCATFTVGATGSAPLYYHWRENGNPIPGANGSAYTTPPRTIADSGSYYDCLVWNAADTVISRAALLRVTKATLIPWITLQPQSVTVSEGDTAKFLIRAEGTPPLYYQWFCGTDTMPGKTDTLLTVGPCTMSDNGRTYYCIVSNTVGSVRSRTVVLLVKRPSSRLIVVSGDLFDDQGTPVGYTGSRFMDFSVSLFPSINGDSAVYTETFYAADNQAVEVTMGKFAVRLGEGRANGDLREVVRTHPNLWVEFTVTRPGGNAETLAPRTPFTAAPYALSGLPQLIKGTVDPGTVSIDAPIGTHYLNISSTTTFIRTYKGWVALD